MRFPPHIVPILYYHACLAEIICLDLTYTQQNDLKCSIYYSNMHAVKNTTLLSASYTVLIVQYTIPYNSGNFRVKKCSSI